MVDDEPKSVIESAFCYQGPSGLFQTHAHTQTLSLGEKPHISDRSEFQVPRCDYNFFFLAVSPQHLQSAPQGIDLESEQWSWERQHTRALDCLRFARRRIDPSLRCRFIIIIIHFHVLLSLPRLPCSLSCCWWLWWLAAGEGQNCFVDRGPRASKWVRSVFSFSSNEGRSEHADPLFLPSHALP